MLHQRSHGNMHQHVHMAAKTVQVVMGGRHKLHLVQGTGSVLNDNIHLVVRKICGVKQ